MNKSNYFNKPISVLLKLFTLIIAINAQTATFTYQGRLNDNSMDAQGIYQMQFSIHDGVSGGTQVGSTITDTNVSVVNGVFTVKLDFGVAAFDGSDRYIEIAVCKAPCSTYTTLNPRQQITSAPYAIKALEATTATTATNSTQLGGVAASQYIQEGDARLTNARNPTAGSANYIQNRTTQQSSSNFNISGTGTGNIFSATTQYNIGTNRVLSVAGTRNIFVGVGTGTTNTTGIFNSFFGTDAGRDNTAGITNSFFGTSAGEKNTTGNNNSFFGTQAGRDNTTGNFNSFFGRDAGIFNTTGENNSFFGNDAGLVNTTGDDNSFFGRDAGRQNTTGNNNSFFGRSAGINNTTGNNNSFFGNGANVNTGNLTFATAIGSNASVTASNTIQLGRNGTDVIRIGTTGTAGSTPLCLNASNEISTCSPSMLYKSNIIVQLENENKDLKTKLNRQQIVIDGLLKLVCADKADSEICKEVK